MKACPICQQSACTGGCLLGAKIVSRAVFPRPAPKRRWVEPLRAGLAIGTDGKMAFKPPYYDPEPAIKPPEVKAPATELMRREIPVGAQWRGRSLGGFIRFEGDRCFEWSLSTCVWRELGKWYTPGYFDLDEKNYERLAT